MAATYEKPSVQVLGRVASRTLGSCVTLTKIGNDDDGLTGQTGLTGDYGTSKPGCSI